MRVLWKYTLMLFVCCSYCLANKKPMHFVKSFDGNSVIKASGDWAIKKDSYAEGGNGYINSNGEGKNWKYDFTFSVFPSAKLSTIIQLIIQHRLAEPLGLSRWMESENYNITKSNKINNLYVVEKKCSKNLMNNIFVYQYSAGIVVFRLDFPVEDESTIIEQSKYIVIHDIIDLFNKNNIKINTLSRNRLIVNEKWNKIPKNLSECFWDLDQIEDISKNKKNIRKNINIFWDIIFTWSNHLQNMYGLSCNSKLSQYFIANGISDPALMLNIIIRGYVEYLNGNSVDLETLKIEIDKLRSNGKSPYSPYLDTYERPKNIEEYQSRKKIIQQGDHS